MTSPLSQLLECMLVMAQYDAARIPTPDQPPDTAWELDADEYCLRFARTATVELMSPEIAAALVPRLKVVKLFADSLEQQAIAQAKSGMPVRTHQALMEELLVWLWHRRLKPQWRARMFETSQLSSHDLATNTNQRSRLTCIQGSCERSEAE